MSITAERGGPFAREPAPARNWMRAAAPGIGSRIPPDESSPLGRDAPESTTTHAHHAQHHAERRIARTALLATVALLFVAGAASIGHAVYIHAKAQLAQVLLHAAWLRTDVRGIAAKPWPWADTRPVARLWAPAQHADILVLAGASGRTLAFGPGHLDGSAQPGDPGNAVITAHRDTHFRFLKHVQAGDELVVERADRSKRRFRIRGTYVTDMRDLHLPRDTDVPTLTLVTCYPFDAIDPGGPLRYVVVAEAT
jgi:sortase A